MKRLNRPMFNNIIYLLSVISVFILIMIYGPSIQRAHEVSKLQNAKEELLIQSGINNIAIQGYGEKHDACSTQQGGWHNSANMLRAENIVIGGQLDGIDRQIAEIVGINTELLFSDKEDRDLVGVTYDDSGLWRVNSEGKRHKLYNLVGTTVEERIQSLLGKFGIRAYYNDFAWYGGVFDVKPELAVCIAFADTSLGKATKTPNNIGNVGNNDRGDTVEMDTLTDGIRAIYVTLNNRYNGQYDVIGMLSQGGRTALQAKGCGESGEFCYATSPENWNVNVINCMNLIYWHDDMKIDEGFEFRVK